MCDKCNGVLDKDNLCVRCFIGDVLDNVGVNDPKVEKKLAILSTLLMLSVAVFIYALFNVKSGIAFKLLNDEYVEFSNSSKFKIDGEKIQIKGTNGYFTINRLKNEHLFIDKNNVYKLYETSILNKSYSIINNEGNSSNDLIEKEQYLYWYYDGKDASNNTTRKIYYYISKYDALYQINGYCTNCEMTDEFYTNLMLELDNIKIKENVDINYVTINYNIGETGNEKISFKAPDFLVPKYKGLGMQDLSIYYGYIDVTDKDINGTIDAINVDTDIYGEFKETNIKILNETDYIYAKSENINGIHEMYYNVIDNKAYYVVIGYSESIKDYPGVTKTINTITKTLSRK